MTPGVHIEEFPGLALGKTEAHPENVALQLVDYIPAVPTPPTTFGHYSLVPAFPMFGNDQYGDCVFASAGHETQIFTAEGKALASFTDDLILAAYSAVTGFNAGPPPSNDNGTDMAQSAAFRRTTGIQDVAGHFHRLGAYAGLGVGNVDEVETAAYLFGAVPLGFQLPRSAMLQFQQGKPWTVTRSNTEILGGHCVPIVGADADWLYGITWAKVIPIARKWVAKYMDEGIAGVSVEILWGGKSLEGFSAAQLLGDLRGIATVKTPSPSQIIGRRSSAAGRTPRAPRSRGEAL